MKRSLLIYFLAIASAPFCGYAQTSVKDMVNGKQFIFEAQSLVPLKGSTRTLTPGYTMKVKPDTIASDLPYVGRAFTAVYGSTDRGMKFTATKFEYTVKEKKKGWTININTKEVSGSPRIIISVFDNGNARVVITSTDRESITYNGIITGG
jgi:hypothetical protein